MGWKDKYRFWRITTGRHDTGKEGKKGLPIFRSKVFLILMLFLVFVIIGTLAGALVGMLDTTKELTADDLSFKNLTTVFYDKDGKEMGRIFGSQNRIAVSLNDMSPYLPKAFVAIEDERFYKHHGIDIKRTLGAIINYLIPGGKQYGASTLTQQLIKNLTGDNEKSIRRKIQEQWRALTLETKLSKEQILELYLNTVPLGGSLNGVQTGARTYFDKEAKDVTMAEAALIAGITQYPAKYNPTLNLKASKERQETVLAKMLQLGDINQEQYDEAVKEKIVLKKGKIKIALNQSYFIDAVCEDVLKNLREKKNISKEIAQKMLFSDGLKIYTTMDSNVQSGLDEAYSDSSKVFPVSKGSSVKPQSAMVVIDYRTGGVVGLIGGLGEKVGIMTFNRATHARRQPGSSIKPLSVYGPALDIPLITPATVVDDVPIMLGTWKPQNSHKGVFRGITTIRKAVEDSINTVAVKVWQKVGAERSCDYLKSFGITTITDSDKNASSLALGGLTSGVSPMEMAAAYGAIANGGYYVKPVTYTRVEDRNGKVLLENRIEAKKVMDEKAAYTMTDILKGVLTIGTGKAAMLSSMPAAGKTGTTQDNVDRWFVGYTPYYVGATWFGYDNDDGKRRTLPGSTNYSAKLWKIVMEKAHKGLKSKNFNEPGGIVRRTICIDSGELSGDLCRLDPRGNRTREEIFIKGTEPTETCTAHVRVRICSAQGLQATERCPTNAIQTKIMIVRPEPYFRPYQGAPMPADRKYEAPFGEYCNVH